MNGVQACATGRVTFEPERKFTQGGKSMLVFSMVVDQAFTATEGRPAPEPVYLKVTAWQELADALADVLKKGSSVYVAGKLSHNAWTGKDGEPKCGLALSAWTVDVHGRIGKDAPPREREGADWQREPGNVVGGVARGR